MQLLQYMKGGTAIHEKQEEVFFYYLNKTNYRNDLHSYSYCNCCNNIFCANHS